MTAAERLGALYARLERRDQLLYTFAVELGMRGRFTMRDVWAAWVESGSADGPGAKGAADEQIRKVLRAMEGRGELTSALEPDNRGIVRRYYGLAARSAGA